MSHIDSVVSVVTAAANDQHDYSDLPLSAQVKVLFSVFNRTESGMKWWDKQLSDDSNTAQFRKRAAAEVNVRNRVIGTLYDALNRASHYSGGKEQLVGHDTSGRLEVDSLDDPIESYEYSTQVLASHPHAWAKTLLQQRGSWVDEEYEWSDEPLDPELWDVAKTYDKYAARYAAMTILAEAGLYTPPSKKDDDTPSDIVLIAALSPKLAQIATPPAGKKSRSVSQILSMIRGMIVGAYTHTPLTVSYYKDGELQQQTFTAQRIVEVIRELQEADAEEAELAALAKEEADAKAERKALTRDIRSAVNSAVTTAVVMSEMTRAASTMKDAGVSDAVVEALMKSVMQRVTGQTVEAVPQ